MAPNGRPYLGAAIGSQEYIARQVESKVNEWISNIQCLATIAVTQPHAAFSVLTRELMSKWMYLSRTVPGIGPLLRPLDDVLRSVLLPALTGRPPPSDLECTLFALTARLGGLGIGILSRNVTQELHSSPLITSILCDHFLSQDHKYGYEIIAKQLEAKALVRQENSVETSADAEEICKLLPVLLQRAADLAKEKGSSIWLTALPLVEPGFTLHKDAFYDALALRYGWTHLRCHLWKQILSGTCFIMCQGWIPLN